MASPTISLLLLFAVATTTLTPLATASPPAQAPAASQASAAFLRARCATTLYPKVCYDSLLPYAESFQNNLVRLARAATDVAVTRLRSFSTRLADLRRSAGSEAAALHDCGSTISSAADLARQSSAELGRLEAAGTAAMGGREAAWKVANAQTWLSAAMSNEATCADGFADAGGSSSSPVRKEVTAAVASVKQYTSNALALVNGIPCGHSR